MSFVYNDINIDNEISQYYKNPALLLQKLIRFNTTNPPGNEAECILFIKYLLDRAGIDTQLLENVPGRPNLIARIKGKGNASPFLMYGHVDVVTADNQKWVHPPFDGIIDEGYVWGRGALDMKGAIAMMVASLIGLRLENFTPKCDIILAVLCDEEGYGKQGAEFLIKNHSSIFKGVKYAIGEFGAFTMHMGDKKFYPIMIAERQVCTLKATFKGTGGHGAMRINNSAMEKAGRFVTAVQTKKLPVHITEPAKQMISSIACNLSFPQNIVLFGLLNSTFSDLFMKMLGKGANTFHPLLYNTVNATIINGGDKFNVIPSEVEVYLDGRLLPGYKPDDLLLELKNISGEDAVFEVTEYSPGPANIDMGLFKTLDGVLREKDPEGIPVPLMIPGVTDARYFAQLGIQTYGFTPMNLPKDMNFGQYMHGVNERIPVESVEFGTNAILSLLKRF